MKPTRGGKRRFGERKTGVRGSGAKKERNKEVFKRRKFARNNYVVEEKVENEENDVSEQSSDEEVDSYQQLLQAFNKNSKEDKTVTSESESEDEDVEADADANANEGEESVSEDESGSEASNEENDTPAPDKDEEMKDINADEHHVDSNVNEEDGDNETDIDEEDIDDHEEPDDDLEESEGKHLSEEKNEKVKDIFGDDSLGHLDPFSAHFEVDISEEFSSTVKEGKYTSKSESFSCLGKLQVQNLQVPEEVISKKSTKNATSQEKKEFLHWKEIQALPEPRKSLDDLYLKQVLRNNIEAVDSGAAYTPLSLELMSIMTSYKDLLWTERSHQNGEQVRLAYTCHALNHVLKTRTKILNNNAKHDKRNEGDEGLRDQGLTRPKVLIVLPFRESARRVVNFMEKLLFPKSKGNVANKKRFTQEFPQVDTAPRDKPQDYYLTFAGDTDDSFNLGIAVTKKTLKLYTDFYSSDIILTSPLGLRLVLGAEGEETRNFDFLNSIEVLILDQCDVFMMQNWDHILCLLDDIHKQPRESRGADFSRVRLWTLDGLNKFYRQTLLFSGTQFPELNSVFNRHCHNYFGKIRVMNPILSGAMSTVFSEVPLVFQRINSSDPRQALEDRLETLKKLIHSKFMKDNMDHVMVFFSDYVDFVKGRNWFKSSDLDYAEISEYTKQNKIAKARDDFYHNSRHFLLYTERAHFFRRFTVKGIRHLIFYQLPLNSQLFCELCNLLQEQFQNKRGGTKSNMSCTVLYTKYDVSRLAECVGTDKAATMIRASSDKHIFSPSS